MSEVSNADSFRKSRGMLVGAVTVLIIDQVNQAVDAGATFIVASGSNPKVVGYCREQNILIAPGVATPTDIETTLLGVKNIINFISLILKILLNRTELFKRKRLEYHAVEHRRCVFHPIDILPNVSQVL